MSEYQISNICLWCKVRHSYYLEMTDGITFAKCDKCLLASYFKVEEQQWYYAHTDWGFDWYDENQFKRILNLKVFL